MRILFVCLGNICRSPTAEIVFASMLDRMKAPTAPPSMPAGASRATRRQFTLRWSTCEAPEAAVVKISVT